MILWFDPIIFNWWIQNCEKFQLKFGYIYWKLSSFASSDARLEQSDDNQNGFIIKKTYYYTYVHLSSLLLLRFLHNQISKIDFIHALEDPRTKHALLETSTTKRWSGLIPYFKKVEREIKGMRISTCCILCDLIIRLNLSFILKVKLRKKQEVLGT